MFLARESNITEIIMYRGLVNGYITGAQNEKVKELLDFVIKSTQDLLMDKIKGYDVDHSIYGIVIPLYDFVKENKYCRDYFLQVNVNNIGVEDYKTLKGIFSSFPSSNEVLG